MAQISASLVKTLREQTGLGMMECKKALVASEGDFDKAVEALRKSGQVKAAGKAGRIAAEGVIASKFSTDNSFGVLLEVNCETDFVARDDSFLSFVDQVLEATYTQRIDDVAKLLEGDLEKARQALIQKIGENITVRRIALLQDNFVGGYVHGNSRVGALVSHTGKSEELAKNIAMHVVATNPNALDRSGIAKSLLEQEEAIFRAQAEQSGKPAQIIDKMIAGRINKFLAENSLVEQPYIKNPDVTVGDFAASENATITSFIRFEVGEGIEKKVSNFAEEVREQAGLA